MTQRNGWGAFRVFFLLLAVASPPIQAEGQQLPQAIVTRIIDGDTFDAVAGGRLVKHARYYWLLLAEGHLTRRLFGAIVQRLEALPWPAG